MLEEINSHRLLVILLFSFMFLTIGWMAPVAYASYVPQEHIIDSNSFTAQNTTPDADGHYTCFDRTVHHPTSGETFTELYMISDDGTRVAIDTTSEERYFDGGREQVVTPVELPEEIDEGEYRYALVAELNLAKGRVTRTLTFKSEPFTISNETEQTSRDKVIENC